MYVERKIREKFEKISKIYAIVALVGARQAGKTTFLKEEMKKIKSSYLLFDDPDVRNLFDEDIKKFEKQYIEGFELTVLDEVQYCKNAGINLKYLADRGHKMWVTASSEMILNKEVLSYLVGRVSILKLYPFSFNEFLVAKGQKALNTSISKRYIWEHLTYGGYPKVVLIEDIEVKKTILRDLYDTMILKDIARVFSIEDIKSLEEFTKYLALNSGNLISYENAIRDLKISFQTIKKFISAMEKSHLISVIVPFYKNNLHEITKRPKIYFVDTGLRNVILNNFSSEIDGKTFENYVLSEIIKLGLPIRYWRTKAKSEVDFIVENEKGIIPVEVKLNSNGKIEKSLRAFIDIYKSKKAIIVQYSGENKKHKVNGCEVIFTDLIGLKKELKS
jgi:predicted AAA+ superfamily ATPase